MEFKSCWFDSDASWSLDKKLVLSLFGYFYVSPRSLWDWCPSKSVKLFLNDDGFRWVMIILFVPRSGCDILCYSSSLSWRNAPRASTVLWSSFTWSMNSRRYVSWFKTFFGGPEVDRVDCGDKFLLTWLFLLNLCIWFSEMTWSCSISLLTFWLGTSTFLLVDVFAVKGLDFWFYMEELYPLSVILKNGFILSVLFSDCFEVGLCMLPTVEVTMAAFVEIVDDLFVSNSTWSLSPVLEESLMNFYVF